VFCLVQGQPIFYLPVSSITGFDNSYKPSLNYGTFGYTTGSPNTAGSFVQLTGPTTINTFAFAVFNKTFGIKTQFTGIILHCNPVFTNNATCNLVYSSSKVITPPGIPAPASILAVEPTAFLLQFSGGNKTYPAGKYVFGYTYIPSQVNSTTEQYNFIQTTDSNGSFAIPNNFIATSPNDTYTLFGGTFTLVTIIKVLPQSVTNSHSVSNSYSNSLAPSIPASIPPSITNSQSLLPTPSATLICVHRKKHPGNESDLLMKNVCTVQLKGILVKHKRSFCCTQLPFGPYSFRIPSDFRNCPVSPSLAPTIPVVSASATGSNLPSIVPPSISNSPVLSQSPTNVPSKSFKPRRGGHRPPHAARGSRAKFIEICNLLKGTITFYQQISKNFKHNKRCYYVCSGTR